jgi:hypothetical protein
MTASITMKAQAERFQIMAQHLQATRLHDRRVWQRPSPAHVAHVKGADLDEKAKYKRMWQFDQYRYMSARPNSWLASSTRTRRNGVALWLTSAAARVGPCWN